MTHSIDMLYDSEIIEIKRVKDKLALMSGQRLNPQDFVDRAVGLFFDIGLVVDVKTWTTGEIDRRGAIEKVEEVPELYTFEIEILGRVGKDQFDHDQMAHEIQNNLLDIPGEGGTIKDNRLDDVVKQYTKGHHHQ